MSVWSAEYRRWRGESVGVWGRRLAIARYGLKLCTQGMLVRGILMLALFQVILLGAVFFFFGQLVATDSALMRWLELVLEEEFMAVLNGITSWALLYPEVCVDGVYRAMFYQTTFLNLFLSFMVITLIVHRLMANDLASRAIVIYSSKALTRRDYFIGKFLVVATILSVIWILPIVLSWLIGNIVSPDWRFFYHSLPSLGRGVLVGVFAVTLISFVALLVSSLARKTGSAVAMWVLGILAARILGKVGGFAVSWLGLVDPFKVIREFANGVFRLDLLAAEAQEILPLFSLIFKDAIAGAAHVAEHFQGSISTAVIAAVVLCAICSQIINNRVRPS